MMAAFTTLDWVAIAAAAGRPRHGSNPVLRVESSTGLWYDSATTFIQSANEIPDR